MSRPVPRARRSSATVRSLVLDASRELFAERGYDRVSTRDIADRAGVTHAQVFRHFGTKANLFVDAAYQPFADFVTQYVARWASSGHPSDTPAHNTEVFVRGLYDLLVENRKLLVMLADHDLAHHDLSDHDAGHDVDHGAGPERSNPDPSSLRDVFDRLEQEVVVEVQARGEATMDIAYAVRFTFALVYGVVALGEALFPPDRWTDREALTTELSGFVLRGSRRPTSTR